MSAITNFARWSGFAYVTFVTDVFSRCIVVWRVASTLNADDLSPQAFDTAAWDAGGHLAGLVSHADAASYHLALVYTDRIFEPGAIPSYRTPIETEQAYNSDQESPLPATAGQETG